jgi:hypothetical protein
MVPIHALRSLHRRSEIMEHNITVGLQALDYLQVGCGLSPTRASEFVRPILLLEDCRVETHDTFTPLKTLALRAYGRQAFTGKRLQRKMLEEGGSVGGERSGTCNSSNGGMQKKVKTKATTTKATSHRRRNKQQKRPHPPAATATAAAAAAPALC